MITALQLQVLRQRLEVAAVQYLSTHKNAFLQEVSVLPMLGTVRVTVRAKMGVVGSLHELTRSISVPWVTTREFGDACMEKLTVDFLVRELEKAVVNRGPTSGKLKKVEKYEEPEAKKTNHFGALIKTVSRRTDVDD